ncbi:Similar to CEP89: Centrosomal protein of 89 kDa (Homo sapiens) [Cotesia congregata]|uniref:Similar to CEP89: Centrosomal protein of 89 kDa (Homo sapiens) n=1 Tax=Cotesia congregata TaxID=51543 RepID=A0A8J2MTD9_COTCN|nr:Similar to CEP89: Centrosomal protein of 89 kDa (Homo sapiens) [Cotesia congregata]
MIKNILFCYNGHKNSTNESQLESTRRSHRRKHSSKSRSSSKTKASSSNNEDFNDNSNFSMANKLRRHKKTKPSANQTDGLVVKSESIPEREKNYQEVTSKNSNLQVLIEKREAEYDELHTHYEELIKHVQSLDQERINNQLGNKKVVAENTQLHEDVSLLKILIYRLNVELQRYQDKLRLLNVKPDEEKTEITDPATESKRVSEAWGHVNNHALAPLLEAYQEHLEEKDDLIRHFRNEMDDFGGKFKEIVAENEELRKGLDHYKLQTEKLIEELKTVSGDITLVKEENDIFRRQVSLHKQKLLEIHSIYEKKVESMSQDNNKLHSDYVSCKTELSNLQGKYEILSEGYEKLKKNSEKTMPVSVHSDAIDECKRLFEELKTQYDTEKRKLLNQLKKFEELNPENEKLIATLTAERGHLRYLTKNLEKSLKRTQSKLESLQNALCSIQVSRDSFKRQLSKTTAYCEELVTAQEKLQAEKDELLALLCTKEKESENIQYLGNNITQRMGALKDQLKIVQKGAKEQLDTVEKNMKIQEQGVGQMKSDYHKELQRLKSLIKQKEDVIGKLQREKYAAQDHLELVWKAATNDDKKVKDVLKNSKIYV